MDNPSEEDEKYKSLSYPVISDEESANKILSKILETSHTVIGMDTEAAVEMSRYGILCLLQVIQFFLNLYFRFHTTNKYSFSI
jgi:hypothetical protein